jgi:hypothetical protein
MCTTQTLRVTQLVAPATMPPALGQLAGQQTRQGSAAEVQAGAQQRWTLRQCSCRCDVDALCSAGRGAVFVSMPVREDDAVLLRVLLEHIQRRLIECVLVCSLAACGTIAVQ